VAAYRVASGENAVNLCRLVKKVAQKTKVPIIPIAQAVDIYRLVREVGLEVWAQHVDPIDPDRHFGWTSPYSVKLAGATGVVINHAERQVPFDQIKTIHQKCRHYHLKTLIIVDTVALFKKALTLKPDLLSFEDPKLIGGTVSIVSQKSTDIAKVVKFTSIPVLVGAGIRSGQDISQARSLGAAGVILASAVVKARNPETALLDLCSGFS